MCIWRPNPALGLLSGNSTRAVRHQQVLGYLPLGRCTLHASAWLLQNPLLLTFSAWGTAFSIIYITFYICVDIGHTTPSSKLYFPSQKGDLFNFQVPWSYRQNINKYSKQITAPNPTSLQPLWISGLWALCSTAGMQSCVIQGQRDSC